jgi:hypothetical protein
MLPNERGRSVLSWAHAVLGAALVAFLIVHLVQCWPLLDEPRAFAVGAAERAESGGVMRAAVVVLALVGLHAILALLGLRGRASSTADAGTARGLATVQVTAGVLSAAFVGYHVWQVRALEHGPHLGGFDRYGALLAALGQPAVFLAYVVGVTAVCFHVAFGGARFASGTPAGTRGMRLLFGTFGLLLWALWLQPLARLATGAALF